MSFSLTPQTGAMSFAGAAGSIGATVIPNTAAALGFSGLLAQQLLTEPSPPAGAITLSGYAPRLYIGANVTITPGTGAMGATGATPQDAFGLIITPPSANSSYLALERQVSSLALEQNAGLFQLEAAAPGLLGTDSGLYLGTDSGFELASSGADPTFNGGFFLLEQQPVESWHFQLENGTGFLLLEATSVGLMLTGYVPQFAYGTLPPSPAAGAVTLTGYSVALGAGDVVQTGAMALQGIVSRVTQQFFITPGTAVAGLLGTDSGFYLGTDSGLELLASGTSLTFYGYSVALASGSYPSTGALSVTGVAPVQNTQLVAATGSLNVTGMGPLEKTTGAFTTDTGTLTLTGYAPRVSSPLLTQAGALAFAGVAPVLSTAYTVTPSTGALAVNTAAPSLLLTPPVVLSTAALGLTGYAPALALAGTINPLSGALALSGLAPVLSLGGSVQPVAGALALAGVAPVVSQSNLVQPQTGALALASDPPTALIPVLSFPDSASLLITGAAPVLALSGPPSIINVPIAFLGYTTNILFFASGGATVPITTINDLNSIYVQATFLDENGVAYLPQSLLWRLWDDTNKVIVQDFTPVPPPLTSPTYTFEIVGSFNAIYNPANLSERRIVILQTTIPGGETRYDDATYNILNIPSVETT